MVILQPAPHSTQASDLSFHHPFGIEIIPEVSLFEIFEEQDEAYKNEVLGAKNILRVGVEAAISQGWEKYLGFDGIFVGMKSFGASGKAEDLYKHFGITSDSVVTEALALIK
jgi:transketolase